MKNSLANLALVGLLFVAFVIACSSGRSDRKSTTDRPQTRAELADSYEHALSDLCVSQLGPHYTNFEQNRTGYDLVRVCVGFAGHTLETSYPVRDRVAGWLASHRNELVEQKISRVCVKGPYPDIDDKSSCLEVR